MGEFILKAGAVVIAAPIAFVVLSVLGLVGAIFSPSIRKIVCDDKKKKDIQDDNYRDEIRKWHTNPDNEHLKTKYGDL